MVFLVLAAVLPASLASDSPSGLAGLSPFGFPSSLLQPSLSGIPSSFLQFSTPYPGNGSNASPDSGFTPSDLGLWDGITSFSPGTSFGFPSLSGNSSFMPSGMGFNGPSDILGQSFMGLSSQADSELTPSSNAYTEASNGKTIHAKLGDTITVQLNSRADQGYIWNLSTADDLNVTGNRMYPLKLLSSNLGTGSIALQTTQEWDLKAVNPGTQVINATYSQSSPSAGDRKFLLTVIIE